MMVLFVPDVTINVLHAKKDQFVKNVPKEDKIHHNVLVHPITMMEEKPNVVNVKKNVRLVLDITNVLLVKTEIKEKFLTVIVHKVSRMLKMVLGVMKFQNHHSVKN